MVRAGLDLDPPAMKKLKYAILKLGLGPWTVEAVAVGILSHYILDLPWLYGLALGSIIAAVAPAVVVACLIRIREKGNQNVLYMQIVEYFGLASGDSG